jgi:hypothetical protein
MFRSVPLCELRGRAYCARFTHRAIAAIARSDKLTLAGVNALLLAWGKDAAETAQPTEGRDETVERVVQAAVDAWRRHERPGDPEITLEDARDILDALPRFALVNRLGEAIRAAVVDPTAAPAAAEPDEGKARTPST